MKINIKKIIKEEVQKILEYNKTPINLIMFIELIRDEIDPIVEKYVKTKGISAKKISKDEIRKIITKGISDAYNTITGPVTFSKKEALDMIVNKKQNYRELSDFIIGSIDEFLE